MENIFDEKGNFTKKGFDPFRCDDNDEFYRLLFYEKGNSRGFLRDNIFDYLAKYLRDHPNLSYFCHAVSLYHAELFARNTKGNYPTIYYWR